MLVLLSERMSTLTFLGYFTCYNCAGLALELFITIITKNHNIHTSLLSTHY